MKVDRLISITMYLLNKETVSAAALAARFGVSKRTIQRDIDILCGAGIPIAASQGAKGGYRVMDGFKTAKQPVNTEDLTHIVTALKGLSSAYDSEGVKVALNKALCASLNDKTHIFLDISAAREDSRINACLRQLDDAIQSHTAAILHYSDADGHITHRIVEPLALSYQWYAWYLFAFCTLRQDYRLFKLSRIVKCLPTQDVFKRIHGDANALMRDYAAHDTRKNIHVRLLCDAGSRAQILEYLKGEITEEHDDGSFILEMHVPMERMWFSLLLGFADCTVVLEPPELRAMMREKSAQLAAHYGTDG